MFYDPIERLIDKQLSSNLGRVIDNLLYFHTSKRIKFPPPIPKNPEDDFIRAFDLKYHFLEYKEESITYLALEGYTQTEIANLKGYSQRGIGKILKKIKIK